MNDFLLLDWSDYFLLEGTDRLILGVQVTDKGAGAGGKKKRRSLSIEQDDEEVMQVIRRMMEILE